MGSPTEEVLDFAMQTDYEDLPKEVVHETKLLIMDTIGIALAAFRTEKGEYGIRMAKRLGGSPEAAILGTSERASCVAAAFANGELANALDWDAFPIPTHAPPMLIPPLLALGEDKRVSGKDVILATAISFEISRRLSVAIRGSKLLFSTADGSEVGKIVGTEYSVSTVICPVVATAIGAGKLLKLDRDKMANTLGLGVHFGPLPQAKWKVTPIGALTKYILSGWASLSAVMAVQLAEMGYTSDLRVLEGDLGYWRCFGGDIWDPDALTEKLGKEWRFPPLMEYKAYPCCAFYGVFLDCFNKIIEDNKIQPDEIEKIRVQSGPWASPPPLEGKVKSHVHAQFHPLYLMACSAYRFSRADWQDNDKLRNPDVENFIQRVPLKMEHHPDSQKVRAKEPNANMTAVEVVARGKTFRQEGKYLKLALSMEASRLNTEDLINKFIPNASKALPQDKVNRALKSLLELENEKNIAEVIKQVTL